MLENLSSVLECAEQLGQSKKIFMGIYEFYQMRSIPGLFENLAIEIAQSHLVQLKQIYIFMTIKIKNKDHLSSHCQETTDNYHWQFHSIHICMH